MSAVWIDETPSSTNEPEDRARNPQAREAAVPRGRARHRRLQHDRGRRQGHGLRVGRQGQLRPARHPAQAAGPGADPFRHRGRQPRPEAAGLSGRRAAGLPEGPRRPLPHRGAGHLLDRQARDPRRQDHLRPVQPAAPRHPLPRGRRAGRHQGRAGPPPRRHAADLLPQHVLRRQAEVDAAQAGERRRQAHRDPAAGLCGREGPGALGPAPRVPDHSLHLVRQPGEPAAQAGRRDAARMGAQVPGPDREHVQRHAEHRALAPARQPRPSTSRG